MPSGPSHDRMIMQAAKASLGSIGCFQKGRSRIWLDDHGWWVGVVEFQPSSWARGSYLNVGATFLWHASGGLSFDFSVDNSCRKQGFLEYNGDDQFDVVARQISNRAAIEVAKLRTQLCSIQAASNILGQLSGSPVYCHYHAAVAAALSGDLVLAEAQFARLAVQPGETPWLGALQAKGRLFADALDSRIRLRELVGLEVQEARRKLKLPPVTQGTDLWKSG